MKRDVVVMYFRRDLRLTDNQALNAACATRAKVAPVFVVDPRQVGASNLYRSVHAIQFMHECLVGVDNDLKKQGSGLSVLWGHPEEELVSFAKGIGAQAVFFNKDYTPFSLKRDAALTKALTHAGIASYTYDDVLLTPPGSVVKANKEIYKVFTPFYAAARRAPPQSPHTKTGSYFPSLGEKKGMEELLAVIQTPSLLAAHGGRISLTEKLNHVKELSRYQIERDFPARAGTTLLSPYLKFGVISPREAYAHMRAALPGKDGALTRQLYWRDFFTHLAAASPRVFGASFYEAYDELSWENNPEHRSLWEHGMTGFPIVDAGMRQLATTGWMHNRVRMVVASFLTKDLHIDWRLGERYFATKLIDYDPAVNNGSWQWVSGTGADAQPWFRIFNPWLQQKKFDAECEYVRRFIPELQDVPTKDIHRWYERASQYPHTGYPPPMVDHKKEAQKTRQRFEKVTKRF